MFKKYRKLKKELEKNINKNNLNLNKIKKSKIYKEARKEVQTVLNLYCDGYGLKHIPVYLSLKEKNDGLKGKFFIVEEKRWKRYSIVIFIIQKRRIPYVVSEKELLRTLRHEFTHYLLKVREGYIGHGKKFYSMLKKLKLKNKN